MGGGGLEPPKALPADLPSARFGHLGTCQRTTRYGSVIGIAYYCLWSTCNNFTHSYTEPAGLFQPPFLTKVVSEFWIGLNSLAAADIDIRTNSNYSIRTT